MYMYRASSHTCVLHDPTQVERTELQSNVPSCSIATKNLRRMKLSNNFSFILAIIVWPAKPFLYAELGNKSQQIMKHERVVV